MYCGAIHPDHFQVYSYLPTPSIPSPPNLSILILLPLCSGVQGCGAIHWNMTNHTSKENQLIPREPINLSIPPQLFVEGS